MTLARIVMYLGALTLVFAGGATAQVTDYLIVGESTTDFDGDVETHPNAVSGTATIDESVAGSPELTALSLGVEWSSVFGATTLTGIPGSVATLESMQTISPTLPQTGIGDSSSNIEWGTLTGWSQSGGHFSCVTSCPGGCSGASACVPLLGFEGLGPPLPLASTSYDSDPWQFIGPGAPKVAFLTEPLRITDLLGGFATQDIDLLGVTSTLTSVTGTIFCAVGLSTGSDWSWQIDSAGVNPVTNPGAGSTDADLATAFVDSINLATTPPATATAAIVFGVPSCFDITNTSGAFQLFVGPPASTPCLVSGNPVGCQFNPLIIERRFLAGVPAVPVALLAVGATAVLGAGAAYARRTRTRTEREEP